jgi:hypothetical protein
MGFGPATIVRLEGALAHSEAPGIWYCRLSVVPAFNITCVDDRLCAAALEHRWPRGDPRGTRAAPAGAVTGANPCKDDTEDTAQTPAGRHAAPSRRRLDRATVRARDGHGQTGAVRTAHSPPSVSATAVRHADTTRPSRPESPARCGQPLAACPAGLLASRVVGRLPHPCRETICPPLGGAANPS